MDHLFQCLKKGNTSRQIICFPYLGGYANSYITLANTLNNNLEVWSLNLPGHGPSNLEAMQDLTSVLDLCFNSLKNIVKKNYVFFGHSMGGIIAYFLTQRIMDSQQFNLKPSCLILSACSVPSYFSEKRYSNLTDADLLSCLVSYDGIPEELIHEKSLLEYFLPIYRADFKILENSSSFEYKPLDIPAYFLWGEADRMVNIDMALQWSKYFLQNLKLIPIQGGSHFFIHDKVGEVVNKIEKYCLEKN